MDVLPGARTVDEVLECGQAQVAVAGEPVDEDFGPPQADHAVEPLRRRRRYAAGGWVASLRPGQGACLRCLDLPATSPPSDEATRGPMAGLVGSLQALSALELLAPGAEASTGRMLLVEDHGAWVREIGAARRPDCPACAAASSTVKAAG